MTRQERDTLVRKLQKGEHLYVPFSKDTHLPFVECDKETFNDQIHFFTETGTLAEFVKPYIDDRYEFTTVEIAEDQRLRFLLNLFSIGVNAIVFHDSADEVQAAELTDIVNMVDYSKIPENERPLINAELQLSAIYFMQELRRSIEKRDTSKITDLEEEMSANLVRSTYLFPVDVVTEEVEGRTKVKGIRFPYLKDGNDQVIQPIFSDGAELQKFVKDKPMQVRQVKFTELEEFLTKDSTGYTLNPYGVNVLLRKEHIKELIERFKWLQESDKDDK